MYELRDAFVKKPGNKRHALLLVNFIDIINKIVKCIFNIIRTK